MSLRQKIENHFRNRSGQGGLVGVIVATVMLSTIIAAATEWYLSMNKSTGRIQEQMEAQSYAYNEWQKVLAEDYDDLSSKDRKNVSDKFDLKRDVGAEKTISAGGKEKDVVITIYRKGTNQVAYAMQSGKARPIMDEFVKNKTPNYNMNFRYEQKDGEDNPSIHAYIDNSEVKLASRKAYIEMPTSTPTTTARSYSPRSIEYVGSPRMLYNDDGAIFDLTLKKDTWISVRNRGTPHFHSWYKLPDGTQANTPDGIILYPKGTYFHFQDSDLNLYLDVVKYYVKYE